MSDEVKEPKVCGQPCEVYSRVCGYLRPVKQWNPGKRSEYARRRAFTHISGEVVGATPLDADINKAMDAQFENTPGY